jgi:cold shock CspA family protein
MGVQHEENFKQGSKFMQTYQGRLVKKHPNYGFIRLKDRTGKSRDVFVHFGSYLHGFVPELNQIVEFEFGPAPVESKPPVAIRVRVVKTADQVVAEFQAQLEKHAGLDALTKQPGGAA